MAMSKKDFVALAEQIKPELRWIEPGPERKAALKIVEAVAAGCRRCNMSFDYNRFYEACGLTAEDRK